MSYLIDTDIASAFLKGNGTVFNRFIQYGGGLYISAVSVAELYSWVYRAKSSASRIQGLSDLLLNVRLIDIDHEIARRAGEVQAGLRDRGLPMPGMDLLIASTALVHDLTLVTHNQKDFQNISDLRIEDWLGS
jgi:tRNA(fMet)-specific endonuclease VapC